MAAAPGYVIIGNCIAGVAAAEAIRELDAEAPLTIISDETYPAYSRPLTSYIIGGKVTESQMWLRPEDFYSRLNITTLFGKRVTAVNDSDKYVTLHTGKKVHYDQLLIATGGSPRQLPIPGKELEGVFNLRTLDDSKAIINRLPKTKRVIFAGGGFVSSKTMEAFHALKKRPEMVMVEIMPTVLAAIMEPRPALMMQNHFEKNGVAMRTNDSFDEILGKNGEVAGVRLKSGETIEGELVMIGAGVVPNTGLVEGSGVETDFGIVTNERQETSAAGVYSAGDVAQVPYFFGGNRICAIWPAAYEQGRVAGINMAGGNARYTGGIGMNSAEFFGLPMIGTGVTRPQEGMELVEHKKGRVYRSLTLQDGVLVGGVLIGDVNYAGVLTGMIRSRLDVSSITDELLKGDLAQFAAGRNTAGARAMAKAGPKDPLTDPTFAATR